MKFLALGVRGEARVYEKSRINEIFSTSLFVCRELPQGIVVIAMDSVPSSNLRCRC